MYYKSFIVLIFSILSISWVCPQDGITCSCSKYKDKNNDDICDHSITAHKKAKKINSIKKEVKKKGSVLNLDNKNRLKKEKTEKIEKFDTKKIDNESCKTDKTYYVLPLIIFTSIFYFFTFFLSKGGVIKKSSHRKFWNFILLITFIASCLLGLLLTIEIEYKYFIPLPFSQLFWHVFFGVPMSIIAIFHIFWHWKYFYKIVKNGVKLNK